MTHVWQHEQRLPVKREGGRNYDYDHSTMGVSSADKPMTPFRDYSIEQQAHIVEDLYLIRSGAQIRTDKYTKYVTNPPPLQNYLNVTSPEFP